MRKNRPALFCGRHFLPGHRSVACSGTYDNPSALRASEIIAEGGRGWAGSFHSADIRTEGRIIDLRSRVELYIRHSICNTSLTFLCVISTARFLHAWSSDRQNDARLRRADADHRPDFY
jgi:hypothetical protein